MAAPLRARSDRYTIPVINSSGLVYISAPYNFNVDEDHASGNDDEWNTVTAFLMSSYFFNDASKNFTIEVSADSGTTWTTVYDQDTAVDLLNTIVQVTGSTNIMVVRMTFAGERVLALGNEDVEYFAGRIVSYRDRLYVFPGRVPTVGRGLSGRRIDFHNIVTDRLVSSAYSDSRGVWETYLPPGSYVVKSGKEIIQNYIAGVPSTILDKKFSAVVNQEERALYTIQLESLKWARIGFFDTFEDTSKVFSVLNLEDNIIYSRLWADNESWCSGYGLYLKVE